MIISLNALISFIGDAFERVLVDKNAVLTRERAQIILDIYCQLSEEERTQIEKENRWVYVLVPQASLDSEINSVCKANHARSTKEDVYKLQSAVNGRIDEMNDRLALMQAEVMNKMDGEMNSEIAKSNDRIDRLHVAIEEMMLVLRGEDCR
eukprot:CAMPEP_0197259122 /NCGR_PEP_ID=MMETSP1429-20130617/83358_1 /TAXON_ID=49237 /ORGANISM="Chaetoceros  sp., Strain UNC1202" /LENGTH=150 /DNA_ID=CAMNT_0042723323 /DNA_START=351 /DNA_END=803 /DNA_ORIENTATION=-